MIKLKSTKRIQKEIQDLQENYSEMFEVDFPNIDDISCWNAKFNGAEGSLYEGEVFDLQFKFDNKFPFEAPEVIFIGTPPIHPHIYSNGYICLSILYDHWTPALRISSIILSIQSMLSSCTEKTKPENDASFSSHSKGRSPKSFNWEFEDDTC
mmetsp:Transcript_16850/g.18786  ORF Transcript_16850/g.18786 Transcript_16850/m.18786 type:complete len:153 (+) Transcript_16850:2-460(+)